MIITDSVSLFPLSTNCVCGLYSIIIYYTLVTTMIRIWILWCDFLIIPVRCVMKIYPLMNERCQGIWCVSLFLFAFLFCPFVCSNQLRIFCQLIMKTTFSHLNQWVSEFLCFCVYFWHLPKVIKLKLYAIPVSMYLSVHVPANEEGLDLSVCEEVTFPYFWMF